MDTKVARPDPIDVVAEALRAFGDLTAAAVAEKTAMAYSTVTPKLRALEDAGRAERLKANGRTFWRLTPPPAAHAPGTDAGPDSGGTTGGPDAGHVDPTTTATPTPTQAVPAVTGVDTGDHGHAAGTDETPTPDTAQPADADAHTAPLAPDPDPDPTPDTAPESEPTDAAPPTDRASGDSAKVPEPASADGKPRRPAGALGRTALRIMQTNPDTPYKVTELGRLIDQADAADGHTYPKASPGAVVLACDRLVDQGDAHKVVEKPATYQFAAKP
ncbi:hypothetical protein EDC02_5019 [Micromonospora sp. Llam0]|uniref:MarR family winged helix-turn-helix transcriptional regulator n=1 Tax=Micromonospora sp. Llam0 TaxID=2485143 RepID=UPI000F486BB3|nr:MarR family winged helix-turn-helix transcriptional regulator [Micromonospora sp. Llam0]ROO63009.1 hypothetical protein EDC02_5019 [Micromonospora sp. Llam0]